MASQPLVALGVDNTQPNSLGAYSEGQQAAATDIHNKIANTQQQLELMGSGAMYALNGDINGEVDPAKYHEVLDYFEKSGIDVSKYRDNPNFAKVAAQASVDALHRLDFARNDRDYELTLAKFKEDVRQFGVTAAQRDEQIGQQQDSQFATIYYGRDKDGNIIPLQSTKRNGLVQPTMPEGVTSIIPPGEISLQKAEGNAIGKGAGGAANALPQVETAAQYTKGLIESLKSDPYLPQMLGPIASRTPNITSESARVQAKIDQLKGSAFLQAYTMLRGGGQITEVEGQKAEKALFRAEQAQTVDDFKAALDEFSGIVDRGVETLRRQASKGEMGGGGNGGGGADNDPLNIR